MKKLTLTLFLVLIISFGFAQSLNQYIDSLKHELAIAKNDTNQIIRMAQISHDYGYFNFDSAIVYGNKAMMWSEQLNYNRGKARAYFSLGCAYFVHGDISKALEMQLNGLQIAEGNHYQLEKVSCLMGIGFCYSTLNDFEKALIFFRKASNINTQGLSAFGLEFAKIENEINLGIAYFDNNELDSALIVLHKILKQPIASVWRAVTLQSLGDIYTKKRKYQTALTCLRESLSIDIKNDDQYSIAWASHSLALLYKELGQPDSCIYYAKKGFSVAQKINAKIVLFKTSLLLAQQYEETDIKAALYYRKIYDGVNADLYGVKKVIALQKTMLDEQERIRKKEAESIAYENRLKQIGFLFGVVALLLIAFMLYRNSQKEKKAKQQLQEKNEVIEKTLSTLKSTQTQLIQKEKLASLGELTAGIAHEIQNPLNFVNNFSELSTELIDEMNEEIEKGDTEEVKAIAGDLKQNLEKINHHGKRASSIVKGMLEHSRMNTGERELTNINQLADEYLRLSYHGLRAKDSLFNSDYELISEENLPQINIVPQEIGRVMLNLINNAFYAVNERRKLKEAGYQPKVTVTTKAAENQIEIQVQDNGTGMSEATQAKIFQPFFTTKPTGEGTGLGLSLAYDIVTKGHGGEIELESVEGEGTTFVVKLPTQNS